MSDHKPARTKNTSCIRRAPVERKKRHRQKQTFFIFFGCHDNLASIFFTVARQHRCSVRCEAACLTYFALTQYDLLEQSGLFEIVLLLDTISATGK
ncbi:hypothetical protein NPIL_207121 [Nephila pilipes]|uniref:Uncharacterized protein n=1 Tax=Nephila pilipes TaxID=299642 RepID=A0A8X6J4S3_NEPPI|nr:hypothetical protein NPIL_207121 [Nephila pilipes]